MAEETTKTDLLGIARARLEGIGLLLDEMSATQADELIRMLLAARRVFVTGKGRSGYVASCFAMRLMQMGFDAHVPGEATCPRIEADDLMIAVSCSGTTLSTAQFARIAHNSGARVAALTAMADSPLAKTADHVVLVPSAGQQVKERYRYVLGPYNNTLFEQAALLYFDAIVYYILEREGIPKNALDRRHTNLE
jgi:6-phospho-3-hexuloisomerase